MLPRVLYPDVPDNYRTRLDLQWPIYTGGRTDALERAARAEAAAVGAEVAVAQADLRLEVARAFWAVVTARATVTCSSRASRARRRTSPTCASASTPDSCRRTRSHPPRRRSRAQRMLLIEARNQRDVARPSSRGWSALDPAQPIEPVADARRADAAAVAGIEPLVAERPRVARRAPALERRIEAADEQPRPPPRRAGRRSPSPAASTTRGPNPRIFPRADRWDDSWDVGVNVGWSLWDGGRTRAEVAQAAQPLDGRASAPRRVRFACWRSKCGSARSRSTRAARRWPPRPTRVRAAAEARRVVAERYRAGVITQTEVLDAESRCCRRSSIARARWPASGWPRRGSPARWDDERASKSVTSRAGSASFVAVNDVSFDVRAGRDLRLPRQQRRRQVDDDPHAVRPAAADVGTALVGGVDVSRDPEGVKRRIGYMSQRFSLYEKLTVDQNIAFFGGIYGLDASGSPRAARSCSTWPACAAARRR